MLKKLLFAVVTLAMVLGSFASVLIVPMQASNRVEAADLTPYDQFLDTYTWNSITANDGTRFALVEDITGSVDIANGGAMVWDGLKWAPNPAYSDVAVFKSTDGGNTWTLTWHVPASETGAPVAIVPQPCYVDSDSANDAVFVAMGTRYITGTTYAGGLRQGNIYRSINAGAAFTRVTPQCPVVTPTPGKTIISMDVKGNAGAPGTYMAVVGVSDLGTGDLCDGVYTWNENNAMLWLENYAIACPAAQGVNSIGSLCPTPTPTTPLLPISTCNLTTSSSAGGNVTSSSWQESNSFRSIVVLLDCCTLSPTDAYAVGCMPNEPDADGGISIILNYNGNEWRTVYLSSNTTQQLRGVWASSSSSVYIVGDQGTILHYDGSTWTTMTSSTTASLCGVWGSSDLDIFAVGGDGASGTILHYDGSTWTTMTSNTTTGLNDVWGSAPNDVFAVGASGTILHYNGSTWTTMSSIGDVLHGVWGFSYNNVFAVGGGGTILHYDGSTWKTMTSNTGDVIWDVWGSDPNNVFAVTGWNNDAQILHYNGISWNSVYTKPETALFSISGTSPNNIFISGIVGGDTVNVLILHYNVNGVGTASYPYVTNVSLVATPNAGYRFVNWTGSGVTAGKVANPNASSTTILMDGNYSVQANFKALSLSWSSMTSGTTVQLNGVWGSNASNVFAVGASGTILHYNGNAWSKMTSGITGLFPPSLNGIWGSNASNVFAVGASGTILHYNGNAWSKMTSGITGLFPPSLNSVWGVSSSNIFAVGASGTILHYNGNAWSKMTSGITGLFPPSLNSIWGSNASNVFAVGASGTIRKYNGTSWSGMTSGTTAQLNGVWGSSSSNVFAVGASGTVRKYNGTSWSAMTSGTTKNLWGVWGTGPNDVFAVGDSGTVLHYNGSAWSTMSSSVTAALHGIWGNSFDNVFAAGASGKIIQYK